MSIYNNLSHQSLSRILDCSFTVGDTWYSMPDALDLDQFTVRPCTPAHLSEMIELGRLSFSPVFDAQRYAELNAEWHKQPFFLDRAYVAWALVRRDDPDGQGYSYLDTCPRKALMKDKAGAREVTVYGVTCVVTPVHLRRRGYSRRLLRSIHYLLSPSTGWPSSFGPPPELPKNINLVPGVASFLSSVAPEGFYEAACIGDTSTDDEQGRPGWIKCDGSANGLVTLPVPHTKSLAMNGGQDEWSWEWIYRNDYQSLQPGLKRAMLRNLRNMPIGEGESIIRVDPSDKDILAYIEWHLLIAINIDREMLPDSTIVGARFFKSTDDTRPSARDAEEERGRRGWEDTDPLVLFLPGAHKTNELTLTLTVNIEGNLTVILAMLAALSSIASKNALDSISFFGHGKDDTLVKMLRERCSAEWKDRRLIPYIPTAMAWYGEDGKGEGMGKLVNFEMWSFA